MGKLQKKKIYYLLQLRQSLRQQLNTRPRWVRNTRHQKLLLTLTKHMGSDGL